MLCESCAMHFSFSRSDLVQQILHVKNLAMKAAMKADLDGALIQSLQKELERYQTGTKAKDSSNLAMPCPTNLDDRNEYLLYTGNGALSVWDNHHLRRTLDDLVAAAISGNCQMCQAIVAMTRYATGDETPGNPAITSTLFLDDATCRPIWLRVDVDHDGARVAMLSFHISMEDAASGSSIVLKTPVATSTNEDACIEFCSHALKTCLTKHESCRADEKNLWLPTRLLDLHPSLSAKGAIRVIRTDDLPAIDRLNGVQYLTLSHTWGQLGPTRLTMSNMRDMAEGIKIMDLPRMFRDTIQIAQRLKIRFLWIDSLCIIQDSPDDWANECSAMDKVYRHGICNISACNGKDSAASLFAARAPQAGAPIVFTQKYTDRVVRFSVIPDYVDLVRRHANLYSRGWVFQERLLSPRIVHFAHFLSWECHACLITEMYDESVTPHRLRFPQLPASERGWVFANESSEYPTHAARWWRLVQIYTRAKLTYQNDKLIAVAGLARAFSSVIREPYYAGIWGGADLILSLLWISWPRLSVESMPQTAYRAPSWSWASVEGEVYYEPSSRSVSRIISQTLVQIRSISTEPRRGDAYGEIKGAELALKAFLIELPNPLQQREGPKMGHLDNRHSIRQDLMIHFVPFAEVRWSQSMLEHSRDFAGIFVQRCHEFESQDRPQIFRRVGYGMFIERLHRDLLDKNSWATLCGLSQPELYGQYLIIV
ncbi:heterokaryon incompatibility protein-domain-containing protein [Xylaria acuta]|nr:heterokaryon incompatibility protein-domain-containing protein [Xylaria acuta]